MPVYEYECPKHGKFEAMSAKITEPTRLPCPICKKLSRRLISSPNWKFSLFLDALGKGEENG